MGLSRRSIADPGMTPAPVVEDLDVLEQRRLGLAPGAEVGLMNQLGLERAKSMGALS